jgi:hypothetical protein
MNPSPGKEFPIVPLDLGDHSTISVSGSCPTRKIDQPNLKAALRGPTHATGQVLVNESVQHRIDRKPDEVRDPLTLPILPHLSIGKCRVTPKPEENRDR